MFSFTPIILSYHQFTEKESEYPFSRTYDQFRHDIDKKIFDWITIDDGRACQIEACEMLRERNIRAKLFIPSSLIGQPEYCTWEDLKRLSKFHDISNHSHDHVKLTELDDDSIYWNLYKCNQLIKMHIGYFPRFFVPPYNTFNKRISEIASQRDLILVKDRITIKNDSL